MLAIAFYSQPAAAQTPVAEPQVQLQWSESFSAFDAMKPAFENAIGKALGRQARIRPACLERVTGSSQNPTPGNWLVELDANKHEFSFNGGSGSWWLVRLSVSRIVEGKAFLIASPGSRVLYDFDDFPPFDEVDRATDFLSDLLLQVARQFEECGRNEPVTDQRQDDAIELIRQNVMADNHPGVE